MSMNKYMHPRNPYKNPPDFKKLALDYPKFRKHANQDLSGKVKLNFKDEGAVWSLTKSLLHKDFGLNVEIVEGRLVPTLPLRMNYLLWIEDLINLYKTKEQVVVGVDIGTGACCIYPLIASRRFKWHMFASEVDQENYDCAVNNVKKNNLEEYIKVKKVIEGTYLCGFIDENSHYDFCMCNPPFFGNDREPKRRNESKLEPRNAPSGTVVELKTDGGEVSFVKAIVDDSLKLTDFIRIYTIMIGCKSSLGPLKEYIKQKGVASLATTMFCQGRTTRWGLAWTYDKSINLVFESKIPNKKQLVSYNHIVPFTENMTFSSAVQTLLEFLKKLEIIVENDLVEEGILVMTLKAHSSTWTNSRKRRREEERKKLTDQNTVTELSVNESKQSSSVEQFSSPKHALKRPSDTYSQPVEKKIKNYLGESKNYLLIVSLTIKDLGSEMDLQIIYIDGHGGKDCAHQLLQCLKNIF